MLLKNIDRCVMLSLDKRVEQLREVAYPFIERGLPVQHFMVGEGKLFPKEFYNHINVDIPLEVKRRAGYPAFKNRNNSYNAFLSYKMIIQKAKDDGVNSLLLLEDDVEMKPCFDEILEKANEYLCGATYDMLYYGANHHFSKTKTVAENVIQCYGSGGFYSVLLMRSVFDDILNLVISDPIDGMVGNQLHKKKTCLAIFPNLVKQRPGFSHCENNQVSYDHFDSSIGRQI